MAERIWSDESNKQIEHVVDGNNPVVNGPCSQLDESNKQIEHVVGRNNSMVSGIK